MIANDSINDGTKTNKTMNEARTIPSPSVLSHVICRKTLIAQPFFKYKPSWIERISGKLLGNRYMYSSKNERWCYKRLVKGYIMSDGWFYPDNPLMWKIYWPYGI